MARPRFGLTAEAFDALGAGLAAIYHNGAVVNAVYPYTALRAANALGTRELLGLAARPRTPFHPVSTMSAFSVAQGELGTVTEGTPTDDLDGVTDRYSQSKWAADALVGQAAGRATVHRPGTISWHVRTSAPNPEDVVGRTTDARTHSDVIPAAELELDPTPGPRRRRDRRPGARGGAAGVR
ncbi:SDR family oxidoreductase, partial [Streptomyces sp. NPDC059243]|uniref:SDR family oxidoreductase n=1 Tax=Streptomyces sp. NPDC059243 TaxID=3346788 RepID=UPI003680B473